jgi:hypothetical protein
MNIGRKVKTKWVKGMFSPLRHIERRFLKSLILTEMAVLTQNGKAFVRKYMNGLSVEFLKSKSS